MRRGHPPFEEKWSNKKAARVAFLAGKGLTATAIARELADGTTIHAINGMLDYWGIRQEEDRSVLPVNIDLPAWDRTRLHAQAQKRGMGMGELAGRIIHIMNVEPVLYGNVLDDE